MTWHYQLGDLKNAAAEGQWVRGCSVWRFDQTGTIVSGMNSYGLGHLMEGGRHLPGSPKPAPQSTPDLCKTASLQEVLQLEAVGSMRSSLGSIEPRRLGLCEGERMEKELISLALDFVQIECSTDIKEVDQP